MLPSKSKSSLSQESDKWSKKSSEAEDSGLPSSLPVFSSVPVIAAGVGLKSDVFWMLDFFWDSGFWILLLLRSLDVPGRDSDEEVS
jgi:hypothetical protein